MSSSHFECSCVNENDRHNEFSYFYKLFLKTFCTKELQGIDALVHLRHCYQPEYVYRESQGRQVSSHLDDHRQYAYHDVNAKNSFYEYQEMLIV